MTPLWRVAWKNQMDKDLITHLRACANGIASFKTNRGDYGICDDAADALAEAQATIARLEAALREASAAWASFKDANTTDAHFAAVKRLDAALSLGKTEGE